MTQVPEYLTFLAEAVSPLSHSLAAGLLIRPVPARSGGTDPDDTDDAVYREEEESPAALCSDLDRMLKENVPIMRQAMADLHAALQGGLDELEELVDELAAPALELVDMARRIWAAHLPPEAEGARALLATLAEAPVTQLLQWVLEVMHTVIDPWSLAENPDNPDISFDMQVPDAPVREALTQWKKNNPGVLPEEVLR